MIGWALGGLIFGPIADRYGRAKTMAITILIYATFTGVCGIAEVAGIGGLPFLDRPRHRRRVGRRRGIDRRRVGLRNRAQKLPASCRPPAGSVFFSPPRCIFLSVLTAGAGSLRLACCRPSSPFTFARSLEEPELWTKAKTEAKPSSSPFQKAGAPRRPGRHRPRSGRDLRLSGRHSMGAELDRRHAARPRHKSSDSPSEPRHHDADHRRNHRLSLPALHRRPLGQKTPRCWIYFLGALLSVPTTFPVRQGVQPRGPRLTDHGFFRRRSDHGFRDLFPELFPTRSAPRRKVFVSTSPASFRPRAPYSPGYSFPRMAPSHRPSRPSAPFISSA